MLDDLVSHRSLLSNLRNLSEGSRLGELVAPLMEDLHEARLFNTVSSDLEALLVQYVGQTTGFGEGEYDYKRVISGLTEVDRASLALIEAESYQNANKDAYLRFANSLSQLYHLRLSPLPPRVAVEELIRLARYYVTADGAFEVVNSDITNADQISRNFLISIF